MKNPAEECPRYESCGAPLCPLNRENLLVGCWYPDEEYCKKSPVPGWVIMQRKIAKKAKDKEKYFTYEMLKRNCRVAKGIVGLNPDKDEASQLAKWFEVHPPKKELSILEKKIIAKRFKKFRKQKKK